MFLSIWFPDYSKKDPKEIEISIGKYNRGNKGLAPGPNLRCSLPTKRLHTVLETSWTTF